VNYKFHVSNILLSLLSNILLSIFCGFRNASNMIFHNFGEKLYSGLVATMTSHLKEMATSVAATQRRSFLKELNRKWNDHNTALRKIRDILMYADRTYIPMTNKTPVYELGMNLWRENVIYSNQIRTRLANTLLELVCKDYAGKVLNRKLIRNITNMLMDLGPSVYVQEFENAFLQVSAEFYRAESQKLIECCDCGDYLKKAEMRLKFINRVNHCLDPSTKKKFTIVVEKEMIENHMLRLIHMENSGLVNMIGDDKYEDLSRMYNLFRRVTGGLSQIREVMTSYIRDYGKQLVTDPKRLKNPVEFVQRLLDEKEKLSRIINLAFSNDKLFQKDLNSSFEFIINLNPRSPEYISLFLDDKLQNGLKGISEDVVEITLNKVMVIFRYLQEKDVFEEYYKQHLAKRLLSGKTVSHDAERSLIVKLKTECGYQFTAKLERMFTDMKTSLDPMKRFYARHPELGDADGATLTVQVLTTGSWPAQSRVTCNIPTEMSVLCEKFLLYYLSNYTDRKLSWQTNMGTAAIKATFENGQKHELIVSTYQMCVLMLFNNADRLSYKEIEQATEIPASDLKMCLQSLALVKGRDVLKKEPMNKYVSEIDAFFVNDKFSSKLYKVKIGNVVAETEPGPEKLKTQQRIEEERRPQIEASIVRIMKSRKQLEHKNLVAEVTKQLQSRFLANPTEVKKRIESLIEREFLERDNSDRKLYRYTA